eukprot:4060431-Amphidinium_carterae.1
MPEGIVKVAIKLGRLLIKTMSSKWKSASTAKGLDQSWMKQVHHARAEVCGGRQNQASTFFPSAQLNCRSGILWAKPSSS